MRSIMANYIAGWPGMYHSIIMILVPRMFTYTAVICKPTNIKQNKTNKPFSFVCMSNGVIHPHTEWNTQTGGDHLSHSSNQERIT